MNKVYIAIGPRLQRFRLYQKIHPDLVVFPELEVAKLFERKMVWSASLGRPTTSKWWLKILNGEITKPILATRHGLLLPWQKPRVVIVDDPRHFGHKQGSAPKFLSRDVAVTLGELTGAQVILGMPVAGVTEAYGLLTKKFQSIKIAKWQLPKIIIQAPSAIVKLPGQKLLYFIPQKGEYRGSVCRDCRTVQSFPAPKLCPVCQGSRFQPYGVGALAMTREIKTIYGNSVTLVDQNNPLPIESRQSKIVVSTHKIFDYNLVFDTTLVSHFDHLLKLPDPFESEKIFETLVKLAQITKEDLIIQTRKPDHPAIRFIGKRWLFYQHELSQRKTGGWPPFSRIVKLYADEKNPMPILSRGVQLSAIHTNIKGQYQVILRLKPDTPIGKIASQIKGWRLDPDPISVL